MRFGLDLRRRATYPSASRANCAIRSESERWPVSRSRIWPLGYPSATPSITTGAAKPLIEAIAATISTLPDQLRRSLNWGQAGEMNHRPWGTVLDRHPHPAPQLARLPDPNEFEALHSPQPQATCHDGGPPKWGQGLRVGMRGFEPRTSCSQSRRAAKLRHIPLSVAAEPLLPAAHIGRLIAEHSLSDFAQMPRTHPKPGPPTPRRVRHEPSHRPKCRRLATLIPSSNICTDGEAAGLLAFLRQSGMPTEVTKFGREHVETFIERLVQTKPRVCQQSLNLTDESPVRAREFGSGHAR